MPSVLIIEDDPNIRSQYAGVLKKRGYSVREARDAKEGKQLLDDDLPDLIILDLLMPDTDGIAFLKAADLKHQYPGVKTIVTSNVESAEFARELQKQRVERYVLKADYTPYTLADLVRELVG